MRRGRARLVATAAVFGAATGAYAISLDVTRGNSFTNYDVPLGSAGVIVFSIRNTSGGSAQITSFTPVMMAVPEGCATMTVARLDGMPLPQSLAPNQQAQFIVNMAAHPGDTADKTYSCTWEISTNPVDLDPLNQVAASFITTATQVSPLNVQPAELKLRATPPSFEVQRLVLTNYGSAMPVTLTIMGDEGTNTLAFAQAPCSGHTCNMSLPGGGSGSSMAIRCTPSTTTPVNAWVDVTVGAGSSIGSAVLDCSPFSFGSATISIMEPQITITGPQGQPASGSATIYTVDTGSLGSATIFSMDPSFNLPYCGFSTCGWSPAQALPYGLSVQCTPGATQTSGTLIVFDPAGASAMSNVTCTGSGGSAMLQVTPNMLDFSTLPVYATASQTIYVENTGGSPLSNVQLTFGINGSHWNASACTPTSPCSFGPGSGSNVMVTFAPTSHGDKASTLTAMSSANADTVMLTGTGLGGVMSVTTPPPPDYILDLGTIPRGQPFARDIVVGNLGNASFDAAIIGGTAPYSIAPATQSVGSGSPAAFTVTCQSATASDANDQTVAVMSNAYLGSSQNVELRCKIADTLVQVTPTSFDFGEVRTGTPMRTIDVTVTNPASSGNTAQLHSMQLRATRPGLSLAPPTTTQSLAPGTSAAAQLRLATGSDTVLDGEYLDIAVDSAMLALPVTGQVVTPRSRVVPAQLDLGTACVGTQVSGNVMLINEGTATLAVEPPQMDQSFVASAPGTPAMLPPMMSLTAAVSPAMSAAGPISGTLTWTDDVPNMHQVPVTLDYVASGTALSPRGLDFGSVAVDGTAVPQHIRLENCDLTPTMIEIESLKTKQGVLSAWVVEPRVGYTKMLASREQQAVSVSFQPPARGRYEAELSVQTSSGRQLITLVGDATGRDFDDTSFYACACSGSGAPWRNWPIGVAIALVVIGRRRRGSSSAR